MKRLTRKIILITTILTISVGVLFGVKNSKEMTALQNGFYSGKGNINTLMSEALNSGKSKIETQTYKNVIAVMKMRSSTGSKREIYKMLKSTLKENEPLLSKTDTEYMTSVADLMISLLDFSTLSEIMELAGNADKLYEKVLSIDPNNFGSLIGRAIATSFKPKFIGGGIDKGMPLFKKAEINAKEAWEKQLIYIWLSQAYMKMGDDVNYKKYMTLAEGIFTDGTFLKKIKEINNEKKSMFDTKTY